MNHSTEGRPFDDSSPCTGTSHCDLCSKCAPRSTRKKDEHFLLVAPGHGKKCSAFLGKS